MPSSSDQRASQFRLLSAEALRLRADELLEKIRALRFGGVHREKNVKLLRTLRHERARVLTVLREKGVQQ